MNQYAKTRIEFHILQSFPVTCLNRDDVGSPKTAIVGGVTRARVSSQCWKRAVRMQLPEFGIKLGHRTKHVQALFEAACITAGASAEQATACSTHMADLLVKDTLLFISDKEAAAYAEFAATVDFDTSKIKDKNLAKVSKATLCKGTDALDIALFGRMVAKVDSMNVEAAASFSHAISTHKVSNDLDFFTALDDMPGEDQQGSSHMGTTEFNSATYYRYISLDLGQLANSMEQGDIEIAIKAFVQALFVAIPSARQATQSGASPWNFARVIVRKGQRVQAPFETAVKSYEGGFLAPSIQALTGFLDKHDKLSGSLSGKLNSFDWGVSDEFSIDDLISALITSLKPEAGVDIECPF